MCLSFGKTNAPPGELTRPIVVEPAVALRIPLQAVVFPSAAPKTVEVEVRGNQVAQSGTVVLEAPAGWRVDPASKAFKLDDVGQEAILTFQVTPPWQHYRNVGGVSAIHDLAWRDGVISVNQKQRLFPNDAGARFGALRRLPP